MGTSINILIAEDSVADIKIMQRAFQKANIPHSTFFVRDGEEAIDFLTRKGKYSAPGSAPRPGLILLDIKMPKATGIEVLRVVKSEPALRRIPVTMLTTSAQTEDVEGCYQSGANSYIVKPLDFETFSRAIQTFCLYWTSVATLPNGAGLRKE